MTRVPSSRVAATAKAACALDDSSVGIGLRVWCATADFAPLGWAITEAAKARFDDVDALVRQMRDDVARTRDLLSTRPRHAVSSLIGVEPDA